MSRAELWDGETLTAEAEGLFVRPRPERALEIFGPEADPDDPANPRTGVTARSDRAADVTPVRQGGGLQSAGRFADSLGDEAVARVAATSCPGAWTECRRCGAAARARRSPPAAALRADAASPVTVAAPRRADDALLAGGRACRRRASPAAARATVGPDTMLPRIEPVITRRAPRRRQPRINGADDRDRRGRRSCASSARRLLADPARRSSRASRADDPRAARRRSPGSRRASPTSCASRPSRRGTPRCRP